jgi:EAL domain-containing protein (putative c-di-GMP-specific phosphodiesterase class I)
MTRAIHLASAVVYIAVAIAAGFGLPLLLDPSENSISLLFGGLMLLTGIVGYEILTRFLDVRRLTQEIDVQRRLNAQVLHGLSEILTRFEHPNQSASAVSHELRSVTRASGVETTPPQQLDKVMGEFQALRKLMDTVIARIDSPSSVAGAGAQYARDSNWVHRSATTPVAARTGNGATALVVAGAGNGAAAPLAAGPPQEHAPDLRAAQLSGPTADPAAAPLAAPPPIVHVPKEPDHIPDETPRDAAEITLLNGVREAVRANRIDLFLQPIVKLPGKERRFFECYSRLHNVYGEYVLPETYIPVAERAGLIGAIDNALLLRCIQLIQRVQQRNYGFKFFCNISPWTLQDTTFLEAFTNLLMSHREFASSLVFEFPQTAINECRDPVLKYLNELGDIGFTYSMDHVTSLKIDAAALAARHVRFIKLGAEALASAARNGAPVALADFQQQLNARGITLIAEKIESEEMLETAQSLGVKFAQGFLLGKPALSRDR